MFGKWKDKIQSAIASFHERDVKTGGWIQRVGRPLAILYLADVTVYYAVTTLDLVGSEQMPMFILSYLLVQLVLGFALIVLLLRMYIRSASAKRQDS